jgi:hypothetical protein
MIRYVLSMIVLIFTFSMLSAESASEDTKPNLGRVMWSAFSCGIYAEMSGNISEQERLFEVGITAGRNFVDGIRNKTITDTEVRKAPIGVLMRMNGPSTDFIIGRIFEAAAEDAFDRVAKEDSRDFPIYDPTKWADDELKVIRAKKKYQNSKCILIQ